MVWTFSGTGVQLAVQLIVIMLLGRLLTPAEFGLMGAATVVIACSEIVSQIGVGPAIIQRKILEPVHLRVAATLSFSLGALLGAIVWFAASAIAAFYRMPELEPILRAVAFLFPLDGLNTVAKALLTRELRFRHYTALEAGSLIIGYAAVGVMLAWLGFGVWALVAAQLSQVVLRTIFMYAATRHPIRPSLDIRAGLDLLSFGFGHSVAQIGQLLSQQGDNLVVGRWLGAAALGVYGRAYKLMVMPATAFGRIVNRVLFPVMAQVQDERDRLANAYERSLGIVALLSLPLCAYFWVVAPELIPIVLGPAWGAVVLPFRLFSISLLFRMSSKISDACTKAAGEVYKRAVVQFAFAGLVVLGAFLGKRWGVAGVAFCVSIAMGINWLSMAQLGRTVTGLSWGRFTRAHLPATLLGVLVGTVALLTAEGSRSAHLGPVPLVALSGLTAVGAAGLAAWMRPALFLGPHGTWAWREGQALLRRRSLGGARRPAPEAEMLAPAGEAGEP
jgi:O-antigen/teichoic acid export membrane protein